MDLIVEGWRFVPHSYSIVNSFQMLELLKRPGIRLFHRDRFFRKRWKQVSGMFAPEQEALLRAVPAPGADQAGDVTLRMYGPFDFGESRSRRTGVFAATEWGRISGAMLQHMKRDAEGRPVIAPGVVVVTPSRWSLEGLVHSGIDRDAIRVVPHGVDPEIFRPASDDRREALRRRLRLDGRFTFLNVGLMSNRKGIGILLKAFSRVIQRHPDCRLVLKGREAMYGSRESVAECARAVLTPAETGPVMSRCVYIGRTMSFARVAALYRAADAYVAPYVAEGFNMPVLEAGACGLPVICTRGGPTDDFTAADFALHIESRRQSMVIEGEERDFLAPDLDHLTSLMLEVVENPSLIARARCEGPPFVHGRFTWKHVVDRLLAAVA
ncbi:MAG: glycosyltransferase family 4 protein [Betaproteobacteria bacterium]|nr:glycosyltransferase family 4 protein [Betaproteobacteria bacterium]